MMATSCGPEFGKVRVDGWRAPGRVAETPISQRLGTPKVTKTLRLAASLTLFALSRHCKNGGIGARTRSSHPQGSWRLPQDSRDLDAVRGGHPVTQLSITSWLLISNRSLSDFLAGTPTFVLVCLSSEADGYKGCVAYSRRPRSAIRVCCDLSSILALPEDRSP